MQDVIHGKAFLEGDVIFLKDLFPVGKILLCKGFLHPRNHLHVIPCLVQHLQGVIFLIPDQMPQADDLHDQFKIFVVMAKAHQKPYPVPGAVTVVGGAGDLLP